MVRPRPRFDRLAVCLVALVLAACATRLDLAHDIAQGANLRPGIVKTTHFDLFTYTRITPGAPVLTVYLEGDGFAWVTPTRLSRDPTPKHPLGLLLAAQDPSPSVAYLARPCQYVQAEGRRGCDRRYWSHARFAPEVVASMAQAIAQQQALAGASRLHLVGYSGGGTLALLLAEKGVGVDLLVTVAGVLDTAAWTRFHRLSPLASSLNPMDRLPSLAGIPQIHWIGGQDEVIPPALSRAALQRLAGLATTQVIEIPEYSHGCCWEKGWPTLRRRFWQDGEALTRDPAR